MLYVPRIARHLCPGVYHFVAVEHLLPALYLSLLVEGGHKVFVVESKLEYLNFAFMSPALADQAFAKLQRPLSPFLTDSNLLFTLSFDKVDCPQYMIAVFLRPVHVLVSRQVGLWIKRFAPSNMVLVQFMVSSISSPNLINSFQHNPRCQLAFIRWQLELIDPGKIKMWKHIVIILVQDHTWTDLRINLQIFTHFDEYERPFLHKHVNNQHA